MTTLLQVGLSNALMATGLALVAFSVGRLGRRPALSHALWVLVLLKLVTPPLLPVAIPWPEVLPTQPPARADLVAQWPAPLPEPEPVVPAVQDLDAAPEVTAVAETRVPRAGSAEVAPVPVPVAAEVAPVQPAPAQAGAPSQEPFPWPLTAVLCWLAGSVLWLTVAGSRLGRFHCLLAHARPAPAALQQEAEGLARRLGLSGAPGVWLVPGVVSPMLWALGTAPRLLVPAALLERLSEAQRAALLVHELAHLRRRDHWVRWLELAVLAVYWWLPVAWWARRELQEAEEECCDAWVVWALPNTAKAYAVALVETLDFLAEARPVLPVAASGLGHLSLLRRRLTMIMRGDTPRALTRAGFLTVLGAGVLLLPLVPSWAQTDRPRRERPEAEAQQAPRDEREPASRRQKLQQMEAEAQRMRAEIEQQKAALELKMRELDRRLHDLQAAQHEMAEDAARRARPERPGQGGTGGGPGMPGGRGFGGGSPSRGPRDVEQRLTQIERKLDLILKALTRQYPPVGFTPSGPIGGQQPAAVPQGIIQGSGAAPGAPPGGVRSPAGSAGLPPGSGQGGTPAGPLPGGAAPRLRPPGGAPAAPILPGVGGLPGQPAAGATPVPAQQPGAR